MRQPFPAMLVHAANVQVKPDAALTARDEDASHLSCLSGSRSRIATTNCSRLAAHARRRA